MRAFAKSSMMLLCLKTRRRRQIPVKRYREQSLNAMKAKYIVGLVAAVVVVFAAVMTVESKKIEYSDFREASTSGRKVQVAGTWVKEKGANYDTEKNEFRFSMRDEKGHILPVVFDGARPNNFELATSMVATGYVEAGTFHCSNILTKCPSKYESDGSELLKQR